jgi:hypothetical protein
VTLSLVTSCGTGQLLKWNGTAWGCTSDTDVMIGVTGGGLNVLANGTSPNIVAGYGGNAVASGAFGATIGGGGESKPDGGLCPPFPAPCNANNRVAQSFATVGGGESNQAGDSTGTASARSYATVGGGRLNVASGLFSTVPGGNQNTAAGSASFAAGLNAKAIHNGSFVWNDSSGGSFASTAANQFLIRASGGVGIGTAAPAQALDVAGNVKANGLCIGADCRTAWPGVVNGSGIPGTLAKFGNGGTLGSALIFDDGNSIFFGAFGYPSGLQLLNLSGGPSPTLIGGYGFNGVQGDGTGATISGGGNSSLPNIITGSYAAIGGGLGNISGSGGTVAGGRSNTASGDGAAVMGGRGNFAMGIESAVLGGDQNFASGEDSVAAGRSSQASGDKSIAIGELAQASGTHSVAIGSRATASAPDSFAAGALTNASGDFSFALGHRAKALNNGTFVWADSTNADWASTADDTFLIRASGGVGIGTPTPTQAVDVVGNVKADGLCLGSDCRNAWPSGGGTITGVTANTGLSGGGTTGPVSLGVDFTKTQSRVNGACAAGTAIQSVNGDGTVACVPASGGGLAGAGQFYFLPKYIGPTTLGDSQVQDDGSRVTIGNPSVLGKLSVQGGNDLGGAFQTNVIGGIALYAQTPDTGNSNAQTVAVQGSSPGVGGVAINGIGGGIGVQGQGSLGVVGVSSDPAGFGGFFQSFDAAGTALLARKSDYSDAFVVKATGKVGILNDNPAEALDVNGNVKANGLCIGTDCRTAWPSGGGGGGTITGVSATNGLTGGGTSGSVTLGVDFTTTQKRVSNGCSGNTAIQMVNGDGTVGCVSIPGAGIGGSGTLNVMPRFVAPNLIGNSQISDDGTNVVIGSNGGYKVVGDPTGVASVVGGFSGNIVSGAGATIAGGGLPTAPNRVLVFGGAVGGGADNQAGDAPLGQASYATVAGGSANTASGGTSSVGGGYVNQATGFSSTISGGYANTASGDYSTVPGGDNDIASGIASFAAGWLAEAVTDGTFVWGDYNTLGHRFTSTAPNQFLIHASGGVGIGTNAPTQAVDVVGNVRADGLCIGTDCRTAWPSGGSGGGTITGVTATGGLTGGGTSGSVSVGIANNGVTNAMLQNSSMTLNAGAGLSGGGAVMLGGSSALSVDFTTAQQRVTGTCPVGSAIASVGGDGSVGCIPFGGLTGQGTNSFLARFISPGTLGKSSVSDDGTNVVVALNGGGLQVLGNTSGGANIVGGYSGNTVAAGVYGGTIAGGGDASTENHVTGAYGAVGGGISNTSGTSAVVAGGFGNTASGGAAVVPGGLDNVAAGDYSLAAGQRAHAMDAGAFVWADNSSTNTFASTGPNQFLIRATGGVGVGTNTPGQALDVVGNVKGDGLCIGTDCRTAWPSGGGSGTITSVTAGAGLTGGGTSGDITLAIPAAGITNAMLQNSAATIGAGLGLTGGGAVALGGSTTLSINTAIVPRLNAVNSFTQPLSITGATTSSGALSVSNTATGGGWGVFATTAGLSGSAALRGDATASTGSSLGVLGQSFATGGIGVEGVNQNATGTNFGVRGETQSSGVNSAGVYGAESSATGTTFGVYGQSISNQGVAVYGTEPSTTGTVYGVYGTTASTSGNGVFGQATATTGSATGGHFSTFSNAGNGVWGSSDNSAGFGIGVLGTASSASGVGGLFWNSGGGDVIRGNTSGGTVLFRVASTGNVTAAGTFTGGGADFAESVDVVDGVDSYEPGDVMVVDPTSNRRFTKASEPYSSLVAGIYSTKPGILGSRTSMDAAKTAGEVPMAVVGIVPTKVSAENGPIERGDLLVASSTPGYAMKGTDRSRMLGAVIGKALEPLADGKGVIEVLVTVR